MFNCNDLKLKIESKIKGSDVLVTDLRNDNTHFRVDVSWNGFKGLNLIEQHRLVNNALAEELKAGLHSISIKTKLE